MLRDLEHLWTPGYISDDATQCILGDVSSILHVLLASISYVAVQMRHTRGIYHFIYLFIQPNGQGLG